MASSEEPKPAGKSMSRRFAWFAVAIVAGIGLYTAGWFWAANRLESETARVVERLRADGKEADCTAPTARGYPFRIGLYCDGIAFADRQQGLSVSGSGLRSAAQVYQPFRIVGELDTLAAEFAAPAGIRTTAKDIRFSTRLARPLPEIASVESGAISASDFDGRALGSAQSGAAHMRPRGPDLDLAGSLKGFVTPLVAELPPIDVDADVTVLDGVTRLQTALRSLRGNSIDIRNLAANAPDGGASVSGKATVDPEGLVDATLEINIRNPSAVANHLATAMPQLAPDIARYGRIITAMGDNPKIPIVIIKGEVKLGIFTIGRVPPLPE